MAVCLAGIFLVRGRSVLATEGPAATTWVGSAPSGACVAGKGRVTIRTSNGLKYCCPSGTWTLCSVTPAGSSGNLQTNNGSGNLAAYAGDTCGAGQAPNGISASGTLVGCFTPGGTGGDDSERVYVVSPITCTSGGATFFTFTYAVSQKIHFSGVMYVSAPNTGATLYFGCTLPVGGVGTFSLTAEGSMGTASAPTTPTAASQGSGTYSVGWATSTNNEVALQFRGRLYQTAAGGSGTVTCKCITSSGSPSVQVGSWSQVHYDN